jgi:DNA end-binding protein Ku
MARAIWSGSVSFGLVNVPIKLYSAVKQKDVHFHQLEEGTGARVRQKRVSEKTGREVPYDKIVKGYEISKGKYVVVDPDELDAMAPDDTRVIDIEDFIDLDEIDPIHFESTYWLAPDKTAGGKKSYALLVKAMEKKNKVAVGRFVMRGKPHLAALRPIDGTLALHTMVFADEIVDKSDIDGAEPKVKVEDRELGAAEKLIESLTSKWEPEKYEDTYREQIQDLIKRKAKGEEIVAPERSTDEPKVLDLMAALEASIAARKGGAKATKSTRKKAGAARKQARKSA